MKRHVVGRFEAALRVGGEGVLQMACTALPRLGKAGMSNRRECSFTGWVSRRRVIEGTTRPKTRPVLPAHVMFSVSARLSMSVQQLSNGDTLHCLSHEPAIAAGCGTRGAMNVWNNNHTRSSEYITAIVQQS